MNDKYYDEIIFNANENILESKQYGIKIQNQYNYDQKKKAEDEAKAAADAKAAAEKKAAEEAQAKKDHEAAVQAAIRAGSSSLDGPTQEDCDNLTTHFSDMTYMNDHMDLAKACGYALLML